MRHCENAAFGAKRIPLARMSEETKKTPPLAIKRNGGAGTEKRPNSPITR